MSAPGHLSSIEHPSRLDGTSRPAADRPVLFRVSGPDGAGPDPDLLVVTGTIERRGPVHLQLARELCAYTAPLLARYLEASVGDRDVVLDGSAITFVDSTATSACIDLAAAWRARGRSLVIAEPSAVVRRMVQILRLDDELFGPPPERDDDAPVVEPRGSSAAPAIDVRNLDRGQTIEVVAVGPVAGASLESLARRLELLATKRQPATLRLDLTHATVDLMAADLIAGVATTLDEFGSRLVVVGGSPALEQAVHGDGLGRSLAFVPCAPGSGSSS